MTGTFALYWRGAGHFLCDHLYYITPWDYSSQEAKSLSLAKFNSWHKKRARKDSGMSVERMKGVEPSCPAWEAGVLPMNYTRMVEIYFVYA